MENLTQNRNVNLPHVNVSRVNTLEIYETTSFENFGLHNFMLVTNEETIRVLLFLLALFV